MAPRDRHLLHRDAGGERDRDRLRVPRVPRLPAPRQDLRPHRSAGHLRTALRVDDSRDDGRLQQPVVGATRGTRAVRVSRRTSVEVAQGRAEPVASTSARVAARYTRSRSSSGVDRSRSQKPAYAADASRSPATTAAPFPACDRRTSRTRRPALRAIDRFELTHGRVGAPVVDEDELAAGRQARDEVDEQLRELRDADLLVVDRHDQRECSHAPPSDRIGRTKMPTV